MNVKTGTGLFTNFIKVCVPIIALAVACSSKAAAHFNPGDRVEAAVTISCPDPGICSCVIPQGTQGTVLCYDAEDAEYPGGYPYFVHWDNGCNTYWDVDSGNFVDYCAESDDWGVWMTSDEITSASSHEHCDRDHLHLCNTEEICSSAGLHWCAGQCQQDPCPVVLPTPHIQANGSDGPITIPTEGDMFFSVALDCGSMSGLNADWWLGAQTPSGWYYFDVAQGTWMPGTSFLIWQGPLFSFSNVELPGSISLPEGSSTFYFVIDTNMNGLLDADLYYDSVVVQISQSETYSTDLTGTYIGSLDATSTECFPEEEDDAFTLSGSITITSPSQVGEMFSASGELMIHRFGFDFTLNISLSGTVTAEGELSGTYTETFVGTNGFYSSGNGTFTGSVADNALSIQIVGLDTDVFGVTCVIRGTFTGSR